MSTDLQRRRPSATIKIRFPVRDKIVSVLVWGSETLSFQTLMAEITPEISFSSIGNGGSAA